MLRIHLIFMRIRVLDLHWKKMDPDPGYFFIVFWIILTTQNFQICCLIFSLIFMLKLDEPFKNQEIFTISFYNSSDLGLRINIFFLHFLVDILPLRFESMDLHIFADLDPDPGSQNIADPMDPDLKHCIHILLMV